MADEMRLIDANTAADGIVAKLEIEWGYDGIREDVQRVFDSVPTIDAVEVVHKNRLTLDELMELDCPVWCSCKTFDGKSGFWCLCQNGIITAPSCRSFDCREIPQWKLYLCKVDLEG